jgi:hypothetical protein
MTPQERQQVAELFDRLASLENAPRDPDAERQIAEELRRAPHAVYALVQSVLVQDEALRAAHERLREYEGDGPQQQGGGFLDSMRDSLFGRRDARGSVPSIRPGEQGGAWQRGYPEQPPQQQGGGGSFLGTAAASAAGVIGGAMLLNSFRGMFGGGGQQHGMMGQDGGRSPWGGNDGSGGDLARQAGIDDIGRGGRHAEADSGNRQGLFDTAAADTDDDSDYGDDSDFDGGDSDLA